MIVNRIIRKIKNKMLFFYRKYKWKRLNTHNYTYMVNNFPIEKVKVGNYTYGGLNIYSFFNLDERLIIGNFCSIAENVVFVLGGEHHSDYILNYPLKAKLGLLGTIDRRSKGPIIIGDDVWIGINAVILSGVKIGQGAVIAAGSVVSKEVPPYAIYTTNKIIKYRFQPEIIEELLKIDYSKLNLTIAKEHLNIFYKSVTLADVKAIAEICSLNGEEE